MRKEVLSTGMYAHVYNRGVRKLPIVLDDNDRWRFVKSLYYFNDSNCPKNVFWITRNNKCTPFQRGKLWPERKPFVKILSYCLMDNHFHLILRQEVDEGITKFMHKLSTGYTGYFNKLHGCSGSLFQGRFKVKEISDDNYLRHLAVYVNIKNPFELVSEGDFNSRIRQALDYKFSSLPDYIANRSSPILEKDILGDIFPTDQSFIDFSRGSYDEEYGLFDFEP